MTPLLAAVLACSDPTPTATVRFLAPLDGETVPAGDVRVSLLVEGFTLVTPVHNEGAPEGYVQLRIDGVDTLQAGGTQLDLPLAPGEHTLGAELLYEDGDPLDPPALAEITVTAD